MVITGGSQSAGRKDLQDYRPGDGKLFYDVICKTVGMEYNVNRQYLCTGAAKYLVVPDYRTARADRRICVE